MNAPACSRCVDHRTETFHIAEMDCAHEVAILEKRLATVDGVVAIDADVLSRQLRVHFDGMAISAAGIAEAVAQTGMRAWPVTGSLEPPRDESSHPWRIASAGVLCAAAGLGWFLEAPDLLVRGGLLAAIALTAPQTLRRAWQAIRGRRLDIHVLMTAAVIGALAIDEWFEAATVLVLFGVAQALETRSLARARRAIADVLNVTPPTADIVRGGTTTSVPVEQVAVGQTVSVRPGARIPLDGTVTEGESAVDQAPVTGESLPVLKVPGDAVYAGSVNGEHALTMNVTRVSTDSTVARIVHLVERAHAARAKVQTTVDRFAAVYTPIVLLVAGLLAVGPPLLSGAPWLVWVERALVLLVIACPCALVIATPVAMVSALSAAARRGLLLKGGAALERLSRVSVVALDKTGTISEGSLRVQSVSPLGDMDAREALRFAASVEAAVNHPLADAILDEAHRRAIAPLPATGVEHHAGRGAVATVDGHRVQVGRADWLRASVPAANDLPDSTAVVVVDGRPVLAIDAADHARPTTAAALARLRSLVPHLALLSGDHQVSVERLAKELGVTDWRARLLPEEKAAVVTELSARGPVLMVGDGINDGPALAAADIGLAMAGPGNAVAMEAADGALMHADLSLVPYAIRLGRTTLRTVRFNVALALALKVAVMIAAAFGVASLWLAVLADVGASLLVIAISLRLLAFAPRPDHLHT